MMPDKFVFLQGDLDSLSNLCQIAELLLHYDKTELLPTILELMHIQTQNLVDSYCCVDD